MIEYYCYIIYSKSINRFYVGYTSDLNARLEMHNSGVFGGKSYTFKTKDWELFLTVKCDSIEHALALESFIKSQKSRKCIENLKKYPELLEKVKNNLF